MLGYHASILRLSVSHQLLASRLLRFLSLHSEWSKRVCALILCHSQWKGASPEGTQQIPSTLYRLRQEAIWVLCVAPIQWLWECFWSGVHWTQGWSATALSLYFNMPHERGIDATTTQFDVVIANVYAPNLKAEKKIFFDLIWMPLHAEVLRVKQELELITIGKAKGAQIRSRIKWIEEGERNTAFFFFFLFFWIWRKKK